MRLVVDSNIVIASLLRDGITRNLLMEAPIEFPAPEHMLGEIRKHRAAIARRANLSVAEFDLLFALVTEQLAIVAAASYRAQIQDAQQRILSWTRATSRSWPLPFDPIAASGPTTRSISKAGAALAAG